MDTKVAKNGARRTKNLVIYSQEANWREGVEVECDTIAHFT